MFKTPPARYIERFTPQNSPPVLSPLHMKDRRVSFSSTPKIDQYDRFDLDLSSPESPVFPSSFSASLDATKSDSVSMDVDSVILNGLPTSKRYTPEELLHQVHDCLLVQYSFQFDSNKLGEGSFANIFKCKVIGSCEFEANFSVKIPKSKRMVKQIYKELLNYKIISDYLFDTELSPIEAPFLNCFGLVFTDNLLNYHKKDVLPCLVSSCLDSDLKYLIDCQQRSKANPTDLTIGKALWWSLAKDLIDGLTIMKECQLIHSDFKSTNILYDAKTQSFKICDLTSALLQEDLVNASFGNFELSLQYCAPEMLSEQSPPTYATDLYAVGLILLSAAIGSEPYSEILKTRNNSLIFLNECIKKNKVLDLLSVQDYIILNSNEKEQKLIRSIIVERLPLEDLRLLF